MDFFAGTVGKNRLLATCFALALAFLAAAAVVMTFEEGERYPFYFVLTTLSTVGYGDEWPHKRASRYLVSAGMLCLIVANFVGMWDGPLWASRK